MSKAQLVSRLIVPMASKSWYVRVQTTPSVLAPTRKTLGGGERE